MSCWPTHKLSAAEPSPVGLAKGWFPSDFNQADFTIAEAARYSGRAGNVPNDIDVLVVGSADLDELDAAAVRAKSVLLREVDIRRVSSSTWREAVGKSNDASPFLATLLANPLVEIHIPE